MRASPLHQIQGTCGSSRSRRSSAGDVLAILPPRRIGDHRAMRAAAQTVVDRLSAVGLPFSLPRTAFATLVDNGLTHGDGASGPVATVYVENGHLIVTSRDSGQAIASSEDPKIELVRRIQFTAENQHPAPGAPAGIPWLARLVSLRSAGGRLEFVAGSGRLSFSNGVWSCSKGPEVLGFAGSAILPVEPEE